MDCELNLKLEQSIFWNVRIHLLITMMIHSQKISSRIMKRAERK
jgi:hypothetical protein